MHYHALLWFEVITCGVKALTRAMAALQMRTGDDTAKNESGFPLQLPRRSLVLTKAVILSFNQALHLVVTWFADALLQLMYAAKTMFVL